MSKFDTRWGVGYSLSVGAVVYDANDNILCHYFNKIRDVENIHILMRETLDDNESLESAVIRGCKEEFGADVEILAFIGGRVAEAGRFYDDGARYKKTTIYFACKLTNIDPNERSSDDIESISEVKNLSAKELIELFKEQGERLKLEDLDESEVVRKAEKARKNEWQKA